MASGLVVSGLEERDASEEALLVSRESARSLLSFMCIELEFLSSSADIRLFFSATLEWPSLSALGLRDSPPDCRDKTYRSSDAFSPFTKLSSSHWYARSFYRNPKNNHQDSWGKKIFWIIHLKCIICRADNSDILCKTTCVGHWSPLNMKGFQKFINIQRKL